jgi:hypothetical protein
VVEPVAYCSSAEPDEQYHYYDRAGGDASPRCLLNVLLRHFSSIDNCVGDGDGGSPRNLFKFSKRDESTRTTFST